MKKNEAVFLDKEEPRLSLWKRVLQKWGWFFRAIVPFLENLLCFVPFFMLNNRVVGSQYFSQLDFYLLYVLLFAIVYGQQQATFSALLATAGYLFRQTYTRSGFEVMLDYNTYVWIAQLLRFSSMWWRCSRSCWEAVMWRSIALPIKIMQECSPQVLSKRGKWEIPSATGNGRSVSGNFRTESLY